MESLPLSPGPDWDELGISCPHCNGGSTFQYPDAELDAVTADIMLIVRQIDALNRFRFRRDAESLAAWKSARDVAWPAPTGDEVEKPAA